MKTNMKTSTKIVFSFLLFAWVSIMVTLLVSFRYSLLGSAYQFEKMETKTWEISGDFSVVSVKDSWSLRLDGSKKGQIEYFKAFFRNRPSKNHGDPDPFIHEVRNDTLFIKGMRQNPNGSFTINVGAIKSLVIDQVSEVELLRMGLDSLKVISNAGELVLQKDHWVTHLDFVGGNDSKIQVAGIQSLNLFLDRSKAELQLYLGGISGQIINQSQVTLPTKSGNMNLSNDKTSTIVVED